MAEAKRVLREAIKRGLQKCGGSPNYEEAVSVLYEEIISDDVSWALSDLLAPLWEHQKRERETNKETINE